MWVNGKWYEECEISAYVRKLEKERDAYKQELIDTLKKATTCIMGDRDCNGCKYEHYDGECPTHLSTYAAKLRLEELK